MSLKLAFAATLLAALPVSAGAVSYSDATNIYDNGRNDGANHSYEFGTGPHIFGVTVDNPDDYWHHYHFQFDFTSASTKGVAAYVKTLQVTAGFKNLQVGWENGDWLRIDDMFSGELNLSTVLPSNGYDTLVVTWDGMTDGFIDGHADDGTAHLSVEVAAVPVPAGFVLLGTALAGLGLARRRTT